MSRDPLEEFFARERGEVHELPAGEERWETILAESRRPHRRGAVVWFGAAAAAAVVAASVVLGTGHGPGLQQASDTTTTSATTSAARTTAQPTVTVTRTVQPGPSTSTPVKAPPVSSTTPSPKILPVPASFVPVSMTNGGRGALRALGSAVCPDGTSCVSVVGSDDDGGTWTSRSTFTTLTAQGLARHTPDGRNQLLGLRFATPEIGYAYGSQVFRTTDGGFHFDPMDIGGRPVLSVEIGGGTVWMVTAAECRRSAAAADRSCTGLEIWSAPVSATTATEVEALDLPQAVESAWLSMDGNDAYVSVAYLDRRTQTLPRRVSGDRATLERPNGCPDQGGVWVWGTARTRGGLVAVCQLHDALDSYGVATSSDRGATWSSARLAPGLGPVAPAGVWVAAVDLEQLVAVVQGLPTSGLKDVPTSLVASADGGSSWSSPKGVEGARSWSWVGAGGGRLVYALGSGVASYDVSTDAGTSFDQRPFRR